MITLPNNSKGVVLTSTIGQLKPSPKRAGFAAAADLGTTTIVLRLLDCTSGRIVSEKQSWNRQASYGSDIISRIQYTIDCPNGLEELSKIIRTQVWQLLSEALDESGHTAGELSELVIAGNTTMQLIFDGQSVQSIAKAPFHPQNLFLETTGKPLNQIHVRFLPCVSGYIGGDITAGLLALNQLPGNGKGVLFLDIGTNGEMALIGKDKILCCAVASGPAFEGAGISCGMPSVSGAISHVRFDRGFLFDIIGHEQPLGLCGSGLLDLSAVLIEYGAVNETGRLLPPDQVPEQIRRFISCDENGNGIFHLTKQIYLNAADIRSLQLAKAAVAAGIHVLAQQCGAYLDQVNSIAVAGGFGNYLSPKSAISIGMLPANFKIDAVGNTALTGACMLALDSSKWKRVSDLQKCCHYIELSGRKDFFEKFAESLSFKQYSTRIRHGNFIEHESASSQEIYLYS